MTVLGGRGTVALVTGGAHGIGAAMARRLATGGAQIVIADIDAEAGRALAVELDGLFVHCDVSQAADNATAVAAAVEGLGGLDLVLLNAGVATGCGVVDLLLMLDRGAPGECWFVVPGRAPEPFRFRHAPGPAGPGGHQHGPAGPGGHQHGPAGPGGHQHGPAGPGGHQHGPAGPGGHQHGPHV